MSSKDFRKWLLWILSVVSLGTALFTLGRFLFFGTPPEFGSFRWIISILFIIGFSWAGIQLLRLVQNQEWMDDATVLFGILCIIASLLLFAYFGFRHAFGGLTLREYAGFAVLLGILVFFGNLASVIISQNRPRYPKSGGVLYTLFGLYGLASLILAISLLVKYVILEREFVTNIFVGEVVLLIAGSTIFITKYLANSE